MNSSTSNDIHRSLPLFSCWWCTEVFERNQARTQQRHDVAWRASERKMEQKYIFFVQT